MGNLDHTVRPGSRVSLHFTIALEDGTIADSTQDNDPVEFTVGDGTLASGLEFAIYGMRPGEHQSLRIDPREGFGFRDPERIHTIERKEFPSEMQLEPGYIVAFTTPGGEEVPGTILEINESLVTVDFNHPLAGHEIIFEVEVLSVEAPPSNSPASIH